MKKNLAAGKPPIIERVDTLETNQDQFAGALQSLLGDSNNTNLVLSAVIDILGKDLVTSTVRKLKQAQAEEKQAAYLKFQEQQSTDLATALAAGDLVPAPAVTPHSVVVFKHTAPDGTVIAPERVVAPHSGIQNQDLSDMLLGLTVGQFAEIPTGRVEVLEIYVANANPVAKHVPATSPNQGQ